MTSPQQILIVEDEPLIAMMLEDFLEMLDKRVVGSADTVAGALDMVRTGDVEAAILDVNLRAGENSTPIAELLAERSIPFVFATGGDGDSVDERFRDRPRLQKPFTIEGVAKVLQEL